MKLNFKNIIFVISFFFIFYSCNEDKLLEPQSGDLNSLDTPQVIHKGDAVLEAIDFLNKHFNTSYDNPVPNSTMSTASNRVNTRSKSIDTIYEIKGLLNKDKTILKLICFLPSGYALINALESTAISPVLYYSKGKFKKEDVDPGLSLYTCHFVETLERQAEHEKANLHYREENAPLFDGDTIETLEEVGPFLKTFWHQGSPFNDKYPIINGEQTVVGCTAIALGQIIAYNKIYNAQQGEYDWNKLLSNTRNKSNDEEKAKFIREISDGINMDFGGPRTGSSALLEDCLLYFISVTNFSNVRIQPYNYSVVTSSLDSKKPVFVKATSQSESWWPWPLPWQNVRDTSHAWVIDGYKSLIYEEGTTVKRKKIKSFLHMNWGWGEEANRDAWCLETSEWSSPYGHKYSINRELITY